MEAQLQAREMVMRACERVIVLPHNGRTPSESRSRYCREVSQSQDAECQRHGER